MIPREIEHDGIHWITVAEASLRFEHREPTIKRWLKRYPWVKTRYFPSVAGDTLYLDYERLIMARETYPNRLA